MASIRVDRTIDAPADAALAWLADPENLGAAPLVLRAPWTSDSGDVGVGSVRRVTATDFWFVEEITAYDPPHRYCYRIIDSFPAFRHDEGCLTTEPIGAGTRVTWVTSYTHPRYAGGKALEFFTSRLLPWNFRAILDRCARALEG